MRVLVIVQMESNLCHYAITSNSNFGFNNTTILLRNCSVNSTRIKGYNSETNENNLGKSSLMLLAIAIALLGNFFIIFTYCKNFKMRTITNTLVVNLCGADLMSSLFDIPFWLSLAIGTPIYRQLILCRALLCFEDLFNIIAILTMCGIAIDRFVTLVKGQRRLMTHKRARILILWSWIQALLSSAPWSLINSQEPARCRTFPHIYDAAIQIRTFDIFFKVINLVLPFLGSYFVFYRIVQAVRGRSKVSIDNNYVSRNYSAERFAVDAYKRSSKTAIILFLMFLVCTLPYLAVIIWTIITAKQIEFQLGFIVYFIFTLKRSLFPAIYIFRNRVIWNYIKETVNCVICRCAENPRQQDSLSYMQNEQPPSCFTIMGRNFYRTRIHPAVFDGENNYFPKNLEVCFTYNVDEKKATDHFTDITKEDSKEGEKKVITCYSSS